MFSFIVIAMVFGGPVSRQLFVSLSPLLAAVSVGGAISFPTVLLHQLNRHDTTIHLDFDTSSWIGAIHGIAGLPSILMTTLMQWRGRKLAFILACAASIIGWVLGYLAESVAMLLLAESFHGFSSNSIYAVTCLTITEMVAPDYRQTFIQMYQVLQTAAIIANGFLTHYVHWKTVCLIMCTPAVVAFMIACLWPESPYWLAYKQRYAQCEKEFTWLRGTGASAKKELTNLIDSSKAEKNKPNKSLIKIWHILTRRDFYLPCLHIFVLEYLLEGVGCIIVLIYSMVIVEEISNDPKLGSYGAVIVNSIFLIGSIISVTFKKQFNNKRVLLLSILGAVIFSLCLSMISQFFSEILAEKSFLPFIIFLCYVISISLGVMNNVYPIASALMPVKYRGIGGVFYTANTCFLYTLTLKIAPYMLKYTNVSGLFMLFSVNGIICGLFMWKYIPDIEGRTLSEIEHYYMYGDFNIVDRNSADESKELVVM